MDNGKVYDEIQDEIHETALSLYEKMLPSVSRTYGKKYLLLDRINGLDDFGSFFYLVVYQAVGLFRKTHISKNSAITTKWKKNNGKSTSHKMKIETFIIEQLKKKLDESTKLNVRVKNDGYVKEMSYQSFIKKRAYYKAGNFEIEFIKPDILYSEMHKNSDHDDDFDPENYRYGLDNEINDLLFSKEDNEW